MYNLGCRPLLTAIGVDVGIKAENWSSGFLEFNLQAQQSDLAVGVRKAVELLRLQVKFKSLPRLAVRENLSGNLKKFFENQD
jgi:hypothetical protein